MPVVSRRRSLSQLNIQRALVAALSDRWLREMSVHWSARMR